jgi:threonine synthase
MAQIVYYVAAAVALGAPDREVAFAVPTGNFGNVYAAYAARQMGVPVAKLIVGTNENDILARFFASGEMKADGVVPTLSPSMDIQVSSNFERLLFDLMDRDGVAVAQCMAGFRETGRFEVSQGQLARVRELFAGYRCDTEQTLDVMREAYAGSGYLVDPSPSSSWARPTRPNSPMPWKRQPACARPCPTTWPIYTNGPNDWISFPTISRY